MTKINRFQYGETFSSGGEKMSEPTRREIKEAFKKTIERWERIANDTDHYYESSCSLCDLPSVDLGCIEKKCPIALYTNVGGCRNTPYVKFEVVKSPANALAELNFLRKVYIWWIEKEKPSGVVRKEEKKEEWVDVTEQVKFLPDSRQGNGYYWVAMYEEGASTHFGFIDASKGIGLCVGEENNYKIEKGKAETGSIYFRILKKT